MALKIQGATMPSTQIRKVYFYKSKIYNYGGFMAQEILMGAMGVITMCSTYVGWHYAKQAEHWRNEFEYNEYGIDYWVGRYNDENSEARRLTGHIEILQNLCADIVALDTPNAAHGVKKAVAIARAGCAK